MSAPLPSARSEDYNGDRGCSSGWFPENRHEPGGTRLVRTPAREHASCRLHLKPRAHSEDPQPQPAALHPRSPERSSRLPARQPLPARDHREAEEESHRPEVRHKKPDAAWEARKGRAPAGQPIMLGKWSASVLRAPSPAREAVCPPPTHLKIAQLSLCYNLDRSRLCLLISFEKGAHHVVSLAGLEPLSFRLVTKIRLHWSHWT